MNQKTKVFLVDDHDMFREGVKLLLSGNETTQVVGEARNGKEFLQQIGHTPTDVVLMDISMPEMDGIEATKQIQAINPNLKILALTMFGDEKYYYQMIQYGIKGFVLKSSGISELMKAIDEVAVGRNYFSAELLYKLINTIQSSKQVEDKVDNDKLSKREVDVLKLIATGLSNDEIAEKLNISASTVKTHRTNLLSKTQCNNTASLMMYAIKNKILTVE